MADGQPTAGGALPGAVELLKQAWALYTSRAKSLTLITFIAHIVIPLLAGIVLALGLISAGITVFATHNAAAIIAAIIAGLIFFVIFFLLVLWSSAAMLSAVISDVPLSVAASYGRGWHMLLPFAWVAILTTFVIGGGFMLLIVPGIILAVWFSVAQFALMAEGERGFAALLKSREYVRGRFGSTLWRIFFAILVYLATSIALSIIGKLFDIAAPAALAVTLQFILNIGFILVGTPLLLCYIFMLYRSLRAVTGVPSVAGKSRAPYIIVGVLGFAALGVIMYFAITFGSALVQNSQLIQQGQSQYSGTDAQRDSDLHLIQLGLYLYAVSHNKFPTSLNALSPDDPSAIPTDPTTKEPYQYQPSSDGTSYQLCATLQNGSPECVSDTVSTSTQASLV